MAHSFVDLPTRDGFPTKGYLFDASGDVMVIIAPATGVSASYYRAFAAWLSSDRGFPTLIVDYRYCGVSFPRDVDFKDPEQRQAALIQGKDSSIGVSWREDVRAAFQYLRERYGKKPVSFIGNSVGGQLLPLSLSPEDNLLNAIFVGVFIPYNEYWPDSDIRPDATKSIVEISKELGYFPSSQIGFGQDIPMAAGHDWMRWCSYPRYIAHEFPTEYDNFHGRILSLSFTDDLVTWHPSRHAVDRMLYILPLADTTRIDINPKENGWSGVGHSGAFSVRMKDILWPAFALWIESGAVSPVLQGDRYDSGSVDSSKKTLARM